MNKLQWLVIRLVERVSLTAWIAYLLLAVITVYGFIIVLPAQQQLLELEQRPVATSKPAQITYSYLSPAEQFFVQAPTVENVTASIQSIFSVAKKYRIAIDEVSYKDEQRQGEEFVHYNISFSIDSSYPRIKAFIVDVLSELPYMALEQLAFERDDSDPNRVTSHLQFTLYIRGH